MEWGVVANLVTLLSLAGYSAPVFWTGIVLLLAFSATIPLFLLSGMYDLRLESPGLARALDVDYDRLVAAYRHLQFIEDGSELWWDIRPSHAYPTIEMRICDVCTRLDDAVSIAALYASLISWLARKDRERALPPEPPTELIAENRWIAQRYGVFAFFGDQAPPGGRVDIQDFLEELVGELAADARALDCETEMRHALSVVKNGTAADRQLDLYRLRRLEGDSEEEALLRVVDLALAETTDGLDDGRG